MPSMRKKLKSRLSFSKKRSKSTSDLNTEAQNDLSVSEPAVEQNESEPAVVIGQKESDDIDSLSDNVSQFSVATDISEVTTGSEATGSAEKKPKKRRKFRLSFGRKSRKSKDNDKGENSLNPADSITDESEKLDVLVESTLDSTEEADSGVERTLDITDEQKQRPKSTGDLDVSEIANGPESNKDVDQWRMSGLLDTVDRSPRNSDALDNLVISFEKRKEQQKSIKDPPTSTSTPKDDGKHQNIPDVSDDKIKKDLVLESSSKILVEVDKKEDNETSGIMEQEQKTKVNITSHPPTKISVKVGAASIPNEERFVETAGLDYEYASDVHSKIDEDNKPNGNLIKKTVNEDDIMEIRTSDTQEMPDFPDDLNDRSVICEIGKGKSVIIRHLEEVLHHGNIDMPNNISADDWLVLNLAKDDWVVVDYRKENGDVVEVLSRSLDAV